MNNLFRKEVLKNKTSSYVGHVVISTPIGYKTLVLIFSFIGVVILVFVFFGSYTKKVKVMGQIVPKNGLVKVYSTQPGQIENILVSENSSVKKGHNLLKIISPLYYKDIDVKNSILEESKKREYMLKNEIEKIKVINSENINKLINESESIKEEIRNINLLISNNLNKLNISKKNYERYLFLYKNSAVSLEELENKENLSIDLDNQIKLLQNDLMKLKKDFDKKGIEIISLKNQQDNNVSVVTRELSNISQENIQNEINSSQLIKSPIDGVISIINIERGQNIDLNKTLIAIVPNNTSLICLLYVPSKAIGFVKIGSEVSIRYQAYPYQKFGIAKAKISNISISPIPSSELNTLGVIPDQSILNNEPMYIIKATLDKESMTVYGKEIKLKSGMLLDADIKLDTRKIYEWILEPLYTISGSL